MVTICQQCGDKGLSSVLIYCCKCRISAVHHYCLDVYPTKFECVSWCCEECESQVGKPSTACNPISLLHGANDAENVETVRAAQSEIRSKKNMQKKEETICLQCGDKGLYEALVFCYKCQDTALHRYCLDVLPIFKGPVIWYCEDCEPKVNKPSTTCNPISIVHKAHDSGLKNKQERDVSGSLSKSEEVHGGGNSPCHHLIEMHCSENHEKDQKFIKRCRELDESSSDDEAGSSKAKTSWTDICDYRSNPEESCELHSSDSDGDKEKLKSPSKIPRLGFHDHKQVLCSQNGDKEDYEYRRQKGMVRDSSDEEIESDKIETSQGPSNPSNIPKQSSHVHVVSINDNEGQCSENDEKNLKLKRKRKSDGDISDEKDDSGSGKKDIGDYRSNPEEGCELHLSDRDGDKEKVKSPSKIPQLGFHDHKQVLCCQNGDKEDYEYRRQKGLVRGSSDEEIESDKIETSQGPSNPSNIPKQSSHMHVISINDNEGQCSENDEKNLKLKRKRKSDGDISDEKDDSGSGKPSNIPKHGCYPPARPMTKPIWNGSLSLMSSEKYRTVGGLVAHLSSLACCKVFEEAKLLPGLLCLDLLPRSSVWPKSYEKIGPSDDSIGLFLFPNNERDEKVYNSLVNDMISQDLAMRGSVKNAELLIFTSQILPLHLWTFTDKSYLWGVFRGKKASSLTNAIVPGEVTI
ncbi:hypothetical protein EZV62_009470 [Acer yangbiense]|uniref:Zinc finger PHD-type domain-containing protein n=1 Tax=Acer yangbiense TaxID=1000413 RepID=A0A5C7I196_9ROSI|nr:hypothetical protein EZV62_009470 [Acer yangbiense]